MKATVFTSDNHSWLLPGFLHQWRKHSGFEGAPENDPLELEIAGFTKPTNLPSDISFYSIGNFRDYPVSKWSDAILDYLDHFEDDLFLFLLEDYWLIRKINRPAVFAGYSYMLGHPECARFDLAADRMFNREAIYAGQYCGLDLCACKGDYSLSFQASIFRKSALLQVLKRGESPWQAELNGSGRLNKLPLSVVGTYNWPLNYMICVNKGKLDRTGAWMYPARSLSSKDWDELDKLGYTNQPEGLRA